jgi:hypothetical protein
MTGLRTSITAGSLADGVVFQDSNAKNCKILVGNKGETGTITLTVKNIPSWLNTSGTVNVQQDWIPDGTSYLSAPSSVYNAPVAVSGSTLTFTINLTGSGDAHFLTLTPTTGTSTPTPTPTPGTSYYKILNQGNGMYIDGYGYTTNGSYCRQYASSSSYNQQWSIVSASGSYVYLVNRATGLYLDGFGKTANGSPCQQYASSGNNNQQWLLVANGSYSNIQNRSTGLKLDSMGYTTNGSYECQYSSSGSTGQAYSFIKQ